jgi:hypothetical protein
VVTDVLPSVSRRDWDFLNDCDSGCDCDWCPLRDNELVGGLDLVNESESGSMNVGDEVYHSP